MQSDKLLDVHVACASGKRIFTLPLGNVLEYKGSLLERIITDLGTDSLPTNEYGHHFIKVGFDM